MIEARRLHILRAVADHRTVDRGGRRAVPHPLGGLPAARRPGAGDGPPAVERGGQGRTADAGRRDPAQPHQRGPRPAGAGRGRARRLQLGRGRRGHGGLLRDRRSAWSWPPPWPASPRRRPASRSGSRTPRATPACRWCSTGRSTSRSPSSTAGPRPPTTRAWPRCPLYAEPFDAVRPGGPPRWPTPAEVPLAELAEDLDRPLPGQPLPRRGRPGLRARRIHPAFAHSSDDFRAVVAWPPPGRGWRWCRARRCAAWT